MKESYREGPETLANSGFQVIQGGVGPRRKVAAKPRASLGELFQRGQGVAEHGWQVQAGRRLIQGPQSFGIVSIQLQELLHKSLRNLGGRQIHTVSLDS